MLSRKEQEKPGIILPDKWTKKVKSILEETYQAKLALNSRSFDVHGFTYPDELWVAFSLLPVTEEGLPVTYTVSVDLDEKSQPEKILHTLVDSVGIFFDGYFADEEKWNDYISNWTEATVKAQKFFYQVTRENVKLSIQAEILLNQ